MKHLYSVFWTHDVTKDSYKCANETFRSLNEARAKLDEMRTIHRKDRQDNAVILTNLGKAIDERGDTTLAKELKKVMRDDFKKRVS